MNPLDIPDFQNLLFVSSILVLPAMLGTLFAIRQHRRTQEEVRISQEFFQSTFDAAAVGMAIADVSGRYLKVNKAMCDFVGYTAEELLTMSYHDITFPEDLEANVEARQRLLVGDLPKFQMEKRYVRKGGQAVWAVMVVSQILDKQGKVIYSVGQMLDIDTQKQIEQSLRASQAKLAHAQRIARVGDWEWHLNDDSIKWSDGVSHIFGSAPECFPKTYKEVLAHVLQDERPLLRQVLDTALLTFEPFTMNGRMFNHDGSQCFVHVRGEVLLDAAGVPERMRGTLQDITELKHAELALLESRRQLRELSKHQKTMLEEERKRIAREIHDELGQRLTALKMDISLLRMRFGSDPLLLEKLEDMRMLAETTIDVVRHIASDLRPAALDLGLVPAIEWLAEDLEHRSDLCCRLALGSDDVAVSDMLATTVFRIVQESLTNIARHARASEVEISLMESAGFLQLQIQDDGCGFDPADPSHFRRFGLLGMRERVFGMGGRFEVNSAPGQGTRVSIELPLTTGSDE